MDAQESIGLRPPLAKRLDERREDLERAVLARVYGVADPAAVGDPEYVKGLRVAVGAALAYGIGAIEQEAPPPIPPQLLQQARHAARSGVALDTVLRRYFAGHALVSDLLVEEAERSELVRPTDLKRLMRRAAKAFDCLLSSVASEYVDEISARRRTSEQRQAERVRMLLAGEPVDAVDLDYPLDGWHVGLLATGVEARSTLRALAAALDRRLLLAPAMGGALWAWLGGRRKLASREILSLAESCWPADGRLVIGEPGHGIDGWRLTHRKAKAAMPISTRRPARALRYVDVALLASALGDEVLAGSLREVYLVPLERERDGGVVMRQTLSAYFDAGRNASSAAATLGVNRRTVSARLQAVEDTIGRSIDACAAELETAIRLWELDQSFGSQTMPTGDDNWGADMPIDHRYRLRPQRG